MDAMYPKQTAATIRRILRKTFPATKFSVTTGRGSGVSSVDVDWTDGPTAARVEEIVAGFETGHFDGMTDSYDYDRSRFLLVDGKPFRPACRYVFCHRSHSFRAVARAARQVLNYGWAFHTPEEEELAERLVSAIEADPSKDTVNALWNDAWRIWPGDYQGIRQGRDFRQMVNLALADSSEYRRETVAA